jgi:cytochrome P450
MFCDPPEHTRLRSLVTRPLAPRVLERLRPIIEARTRAVFDRVADRGAFNLVTDIAYPLPVSILAELLALPEELEDELRQSLTQLARCTRPVLLHLLDPTFAVSAERAAEQARVLASLHGLLSTFVPPGGGGLRELFGAGDGGAGLSDEEVMSNVMMLLVAGHETTTGLIGNGALALLRHPDQLQLLRDDPRLCRGAVDEALRFDPPIQLTARHAWERTEIGGVRLQPGDVAIPLIASANRDALRFAASDRFHIRPDNGPLSFGAGPHFCPGAPLARMQAEAVLRQLVARFRTAEPIEEELAYRPDVILRRLTSLPLRVELS